MTEVQNYIGRTAIDADGSKIGTIGQVYLDDSTGEPQWVTVSTGMFGNKESFAPIYGSRMDGDNIVLTVDKDAVKGAPKVEDDEHLDESEVNDLYTYYRGHLGEQGTTTTETTGTADYTRSTEQTSDYTEGHDTSGPNTDDAMTLSEERLHVGTENVQSGRARLRKYIVTENVTQTVPVSHEEVRIEREPITDANRGDALSGADISEEEHEITLNAERAVVSKETVPVERVRIGTETVTEQQEVSDTVRKEEIDTSGVEVDGDAEHTTR